MLDLTKKYRLITRSDFDGLVCALLLNELGIISEVKFVHPKDMQDGKVDVNSNDITANLPYNPNAHFVFDHHLSETMRNKNISTENYKIDPKAPSAARVIYNYFGGKQKFPHIQDDLMDAVDKSDAAYFTTEDVLYPKKWVLLNFLMDPRSGLGRFKDFRISNYELMLNLITYCKNHTIEEILKLPDVKERVDMYFKHHENFHEQITSTARIVKNLIVLDLRNIDPIYVGNRFAVYALFPNCNASVHVMWGFNRQNTVFAVGKSIFKRNCKTNIGELMLEYGGGGHANAGTCQVENDRADQVLKELIEKITTKG